MNAHTSFNAGLIEKSFLAQTRQVYVYAPPLKGMIVFEMAPLIIFQISGGRIKKRA